MKEIISKFDNAIKETILLRPINRTILRSIKDLKNFIERDQKRFSKSDISWLDVDKFIDRNLKMAKENIGKETKFKKEDKSPQQQPSPVNQDKK